MCISWIKILLWNTWWCWQFGTEIDPEIVQEFYKHFYLLPQSLWSHPVSPMLYRALKASSLIMLFRTFGFSWFSRKMLDLQGWIVLVEYLLTNITGQHAPCLRTIYTPHTHKDTLLPTCPVSIVCCVPYSFCVWHRPWKFQTSEEPKTCW